MTLNDHYALASKYTRFRSPSRKYERRQTYNSSEDVAQGLWQYKAYADIRVGSLKMGFKRQWVVENGNFQYFRSLFLQKADIVI